MSKKGGWVPIDKELVGTFRNINRPFSYIEAMYSYTIDHDNGKEWTYRGYAKLWQWSVGKVKRFVDGMRNSSGTVVERKGNGSGTLVHFIDKVLWGLGEQSENSSGTVAEQLEVGTSNPNPKPKVIKKKYGEFKNVLLTEKQLAQLHEKFNSSTDAKIDNLSSALNIHGYKYKSHYHVILKWAKNDKTNNSANESQSEKTKKELYDKLK